jgi:hypothetical protein
LNVTVIEPGSPAAGIVERAKNIILTPSVEFDRIATETPSPQSLYTGYALPLIVASALAGVIGGLVFGYGGFGIHYRPSPVSAISSGIISIVFMLAGVWVLARIVDFLAPNFGGVRGEAQSTQVAVYSGTAGWLAGLFAIFPPLAILAILGLYSIFLLYRALPRLMKSPPEKSAGYTAAVVVAAIVIGIILSALSTAILGAIHMGPMMGQANRGAELGGTVTLPGGGEVKLNDLQDAAKKFEDAAESTNGVVAINVDTLKGLLPETLPGGFTRTEISTGSGGALGYSGTNAEAKYTRGESTLTLSATDLGAAGALAAMAGALGVQASEETATTYSKTGTVNGRLTQEEADKDAKTATFMVIAGKRVVLQAEGSNVTIDEVKAAVNAVGVDRVEALAKAAQDG